MGFDCIYNLYSLFIGGKICVAVDKTLNASTACLRNLETEFLAYISELSSFLLFKIRLRLSI